MTAFQMTPHLYDKIKYFARFPQTGVSLRQMVMFGQKPSQGTLFKASQFLHEEMPIRLAHNVKELEELPKNLSSMPSIVKVKNWYAQSFQDLIELRPPRISNAVKTELWEASALSETSALPISIPNPSLRNIIPPQIKSSKSPSSSPRNISSTTSKHASVSLDHRHHRYYTNLETFQCPAEIAEYNQSFTRTIEAIKLRHDPVVTTLAQGILEYKERAHSQSIDADIQQFLDRFYMSRIGMRTLIGQHATLARGGVQEKDYVGVICTRTNIKQIARDAIASARAVCESHYGLAPDVDMFCPADIEFLYVPSHLNHMLFELLKNSLRAVVERFGGDSPLPPIKVTIAYGREDITIKISDQGGGIPRSGIPLVWTYMYTTADAQELEHEYNQSEFKAPMAGFGYGLPLSRLYARYFGGDLKLISMEGHGTDVYLHLNRLSNSDEPLIACKSFDDDHIIEHVRPLASLPSPVMRRPTFSSRHFFSNAILRQHDPTPLTL